MAAARRERTGSRQRATAWSSAPMARRRAKRADWARSAVPARHARRSRSRPPATESPASPLPSDDRQRALVDRHTRPDHRDVGALAVADDDADVGDRNHRAGRRLELDATGRPRNVADEHAVLQLRLQQDLLNGRRDRRGQGGHFAYRPEAAGPDRMVAVALLELDPHGRA